MTHNPTHTTASSESCPSPDYAKAVRVLMAETGLTSRTLAARSGFKREYISRVRNGRLSPLPRLADWAAAFGVSPSAFVRRAEDYGAGDIPYRWPGALAKMNGNPKGTSTPC